MGVLLEAFYQRGIKGVPSPEDGDQIDAWWDHLVLCRINDYTQIHAAFFSRLFGFVHPGEISSSR